MTPMAADNSVACVVGCGEVVGVAVGELLTRSWFVAASGYHYDSS